jgi:aspartate carbamoyltransferase regulatory subunit
MNDAMKARIELVEKTRKLLSTAFDSLAEVCDHRDENGSKHYYFDRNRDAMICHYCEQDIELG